MCASAAFWRNEDLITGVRNSVDARSHVNLAWGTNKPTDTYMVQHSGPRFESPFLFQLLTTETLRRADPPSKDLDELRFTERLRNSPRLQWTQLGVPLE